MPARLRAEKTPWLLLLVFILLSAGIAAVGLSYYNAEKATHLEHQRSQLAAIADLKIGQIEAWRLERLGDASIIRQNTLVNAQVEEFLASGAAGLHRREIVVWLDSLAQAYDYAEAVLVAPDGSVRLASPPSAAWVGPTGQTMVGQVLQTGEAAFSDLHRAGPEAMVHLDVVIPLRVEVGGGPRPIGVLILRIDPSIYLFPLIQSWPTSSPSAETLLVRREGDQVLYLNELRHASDPALTLSFPVTQTDLPEAMAVQGVQGVVEGNDYRGVPVMAVLRPVPNTSWYMVAEVDSEEILAPVVRQGQLVGGIVVILVLVAGVSTALLWRVQSAEFGRKQYEAELERKVLTEHFGYLSKYANDAILLADEQGNLLEANERAEAVYGCSRDDLLRMNVRDLRSAEERAEYPEDMRQVVERNGMVFETIHMRKDGTTFPVEVSSRFIEVEGKRFYQDIIRDITERKRAEKALQESEARYRRLHESMTDCYVQTTMLGSIVDVNRSYLAMLGYSEEEAFKLRYQDLTPARWHAFEQQIVETQIMPWGYSDVYEKEYIRKDGTVFPVELRTYLLRDAQGQPSGMWAIVRDITERKRADEALRESEERYELANRATFDTIWDWNLQTNALWWNENFQTLFGYRAEEIEPGIESWTNRIHPEDLDRIEAGIHAAIDSGRQSWSDQYRFRRKDGVYAEIHDRGYISREASGNPVRMIGAMQDITERMRTEEQLRLDHAIMTSVSDGVYVIRVSDGTILFASRQFEKMFGYNPGELIGKHVSAVNAPTEKDPQETANQIIEELNQHGIWRGEVLNIKKDGTAFWCDASVTTLTLERAEYGTVWVSVHRDITERKRAEAALTTSEVRYRRLFEAARDGILILDADTGMVVDVNPFLVEMLGYSREQFLGKKIWELGVFKDIAANKANFLELQQKEYITFENLPLETAKGRLINVEFVSHVYRVDRSKVIQCNIRDLTERKRQEAELLASHAELQRLLAEADQARRALLREVEDRRTAEEEVRRLNAELEQRVLDRTAQLEAANQELEAFSYSVSHDLRAPLRAIDGFSRIVLDEHAPALAPEAQRYLHLVQDNTQQMGRLVDDLLAFSHLSRQPMAKQRVDPADLVHAALQNLHAEQAGRQIDLVIRDLPTCQADPALLKQVWVNLLSNALKFTRPRERTVIEVGAYEEDTHPVYYVKDNGVGFDMRYVGKLFGVFQRLHRSEEYEGTGVGLAIVQRIVHRHGGRVWAEAKVDQGATFWFTLEGGTGNDEGHRGDPAGRGQSE